MSTTNAMTFTASFSVNNATLPNPQGFSWTNLQFNQTGTEVIQVQSMSIPTTSGGTAIPLGGIATPRWAIFWNLDPTNYISIFNGSMGTEFIRLLSAGAGAGPFGDPCILPLGPSVVPYAQANTAACNLAFLICAA